MSLCRGFNILRDDRMCFGKVICQTQILITHHFQTNIIFNKKEINP